MRNLARRHPVSALVIILFIALVLARWFFAPDWQLWAVIFTILAVFVWLVGLLGAGLNRVERNTIVIVRNGGEGFEVFHRQQPLRPDQQGPQPPVQRVRQQSSTPHAPQQRRGGKRHYFSAPPFTSVEAYLPGYPIRYEVPVEHIDTNTPMLSRIDKITVRMDCRIDGAQALTFYERAIARIGRLQGLEERTKLLRIDLGLWEEFLHEVVGELVDDAVRDVIWMWPAQQNDPYSLSKNRRELASKTQTRLAMELAQWGLTLIYHQVNEDAPQPPDAPAAPQPETPRGAAERAVARAATARQAADQAIANPAPSPSPTPNGARVPNGSRPAAATVRSVGVVLETIEINPEIVRGKNWDYDRALKKKTEEATVAAAEIRAKGFAEAEVRARNLALILDELISNREVPLDDPLIAEVVRSALYSDGQMIRQSMMEKGHLPTETPRKA